LYTTDAKGNKFIDADKPINRNEATKIMMLAYNKIYPQAATTGNYISVLRDITNANDQYYSYIRQAEKLGFISGIPQASG